MCEEGQRSELAESRVQTEELPQMGKGTRSARSADYREKRTCSENAVQKRTTTTTTHDDADAASTSSSSSPHQVQEIVSQRNGQSSLSRSKVKWPKKKLRMCCCTNITSSTFFGRTKWGC